MKHDYRDILRTEIDERCKRNPSYSMRAFAKTVGIKPPHLSAILNGRKGLSAESAMRVANKLGWTEREAEQFVDLVNIQHARKGAVRKKAQQRIETFSKSNSFKAMDLDHFRLISDWHHLAILHLAELEDFQPDVDWIAARLGLDSQIVSEAVERLKKLNFVEVDGSSWRPKRKFMATPNVPSRAIRHHLHQGLSLAGRALEEQPLEARDFSTVVMAIDRDSLPEAKAWLRDFRRKFCHDLDKSKTKNAIYCLSTQFFELTKKGKK